MRDLFHLPDQNPLTVGGLAKFCNASAEGAVNISCVWNNPQINFAGLLVRINNINSGGSSTLFDFGTTSSSLLSLNTSGRLVMGSNTFGPPSIGGLTLTMSTVGGNVISFGNFGSGLLGMQLLSSGSITFSNTTSFGFSVADVGLYRGGIGILSQRYGANPQEFRLFNTHNGTNDEWAFLKWDANIIKIGTAATGTGVVRNLMFTGDIYLSKVGVTISGATGSSISVGCPNGNTYLGNTSVFGGNVLVGLGVGGIGVPGLKIPGNGVLAFASDNTSYGSTRHGIYSGASSPESSISASPGSLYIRDNAGNGELWIKTTGTGNTGWTQLTIP